MAVFLVNQCTFSKLPNVSNDPQTNHTSISNGASQSSQNSNDSTSNLSTNSVGAGLTSSNICGLKFDSLFELIQHIEDEHITELDYPELACGPIYNGISHQQPAPLPIAQSAIGNQSQPQGAQTPQPQPSQHLPPSQPSPQPPSTPQPQQQQPPPPPPSTPQYQQQQQHHLHHQHQPTSLQQQLMQPQPIYSQNYDPASNQFVVIAGPNGSLVQVPAHLKDSNIYNFIPNDRYHMTQIMSGGWLPTSCVLRVFDSSHKNSHHHLHQQQHQQQQHHQQQQQQQHLLHQQQQHQPQQHQLAQTLQHQRQPHQIQQQPHQTHQLMHKLQATPHHLQTAPGTPVMQPQQIKYEPGVVMTQCQDPQQQQQQQATNVIAPLVATHMQPQMSPLTPTQMQPQQQGLHAQQMIALQQQQMAQAQMQQIQVPQQPQQQIPLQPQQQMPVQTQTMPIHQSQQPMPIHQPQQTMNIHQPQQQQQMVVHQQIPMAQPSQQLQQQLTLDTSVAMPANSPSSVAGLTTVAQQQPNQIVGSPQVTQGNNIQTQQPAKVTKTVDPASTPKPAKYPCKDCNRAYKTPHGLRTHQTTHHQKSLQAQQQMPVQQQQPMPMHQTKQPQQQQMVVHQRPVPIPQQTQQLQQLTLDTSGTMTASSPTSVTGLTPVAPQQQLQQQQQQQSNQIVNSPQVVTQGNSIQLQTVKATKVVDPNATPKPAKYPCKDCSRTYKTPHGLRTHQTTHHQKKSPTSDGKTMASVPVGGDTPSGSPADLPQQQDKIPR